MKTLQVKMNKRDAAIQKKYQEQGIPMFNADGSVKKQKRKIPKGVLIAVAVVIGLASLIYLPGVFMDSKESNIFVLEPNVLGVKRVTDAAKNNPEIDFDGDGLSNSLETKYGTSPRKEDTDEDGISDYAEIFITETNPLKAEDTLIRYVQNMDGAKSASEPMKINNVVVWPKNLHSRVYGGVAQTRIGYYFHDFEGWAEFPEGKYAYKFENGVHTLLEHKAEENAWKIEGEKCEVVLTDEPLEMVNYLKFLNLGSVYLPDNLFGNTVSAILPDNGLLTCKKMAKIDTWVDAGTIVSAQIVTIDYDTDNLMRYGENQNGLSDLAKVYHSIDENSSVLVSLNSTEYGEVIAEVYGYTVNGDLLLANPDTLEPVGMLAIEEVCKRFMDNNGDIVYREWFEFRGIGFDSKLNFDRINFFAAAIDNKGVFNPKETLPKESSVTEPVSAQDNEDTTNNISSETTSADIEAG